MWKEFKEFAFKGNVLDMSIGVIIGSAFRRIVRLFSIFSSLYSKSASCTRKQKNRPPLHRQVRPAKNC